MFQSIKENNLTAPAIVIGIAIVLSAFIFRDGASIFANKSDSITVTGSAERYVTSDTAKWFISISLRAQDNHSGNIALASEVKAIQAYLLKNGITEDKVTVNNQNSSPICKIGPQGYENCSLGIEGYTFSQTVVAELDDVKKISDLSKKINTDLDGYDLSSNVEYYYNNLKNIRAEMLSEATKNALERANSVASAGGASIGKITSLSSGVFQVTAKNSVGYEDSGSYDTSALEKRITATVKANFSVR